MIGCWTRCNSQLWCFSDLKATYTITPQPEKNRDWLLDLRSIVIICWVPSKLQAVTQQPIKMLLRYSDSWSEGGWGQSQEDKIREGQGYHSHGWSFVSMAWCSALQGHHTIIDHLQLMSTPVTLCTWVNFLHLYLPTHKVTPNKKSMGKWSLTNKKKWIATMRCSCANTHILPPQIFLKISRTCTKKMQVHYWFFLHFSSIQHDGVGTGRKSISVCGCTWV